MHSTTSPPSAAATRSTPPSWAALFGEAPGTGLVLGSGMGGVLDALDAVEWAGSHGDLGLPGPRVAGHGGRAVVGRLGGCRVLALAGRVHPYEGRPDDEVAGAVRAMARAGMRRVVLTSAVGGLVKELVPGALVRVTDHLNFSGCNPLRGLPSLDLGPSFPDLAGMYEGPLARAMDKAAVLGRVGLRREVYACMPGPSYESPAEVRWLAGLGVLVVGMSLAPEAIAARQAGLEVVGLAVVANAAAGLWDEPLRHEDVTAAMGAAAGAVAGLLEASLRLCPA